MALGVLQRGEDRTRALATIVSELAIMDEPRKRLAGVISGLDIHYDLGEGHPLLGRRMPDLDLVTDDGPLRVFELLHDARPVLLNLGEPGASTWGSGRAASNWSTPTTTASGNSRCSGRSPPRPRF